MNADRAIQIMNKMAAVRRSQDIDEQQKTILLSSLKNQLDAATGQLSLDQIKPPADEKKAAK